jgi:hypothetical protein
MQLLKALFASLVVATTLSAGEYDKASVGLQIDVTSVSAAKVPFQNAAGNIQGAEAKTLGGVGLVANLRLGEIFTEKLSAFAVVPSLTYRFGRESDSQFFANYNFYSPDGSVTSIQNANVNRMTNDREVVIDVPFRWHVNGDATYGGFFVEGGPVFANLQQTVDLAASGLVLSTPSTVQESSRISTTTTGFSGGIGFMRVYRTSQSAVLLKFQSLKGDQTRSSRNEIRLGFQWTF